MKIKMKNQLNQSFIEIDNEMTYEEDYQLKMIQHNEIEGLLPISCTHVEDSSYFQYEITDMQAMEMKYQREALNFSQLKLFLLSLCETIERVKDHLLEDRKLLLHPKFIFCKNEQWYFMYNPCILFEGEYDFHNLAEYFVEHIDYHDEQGVELAYQLHKESMEKNFSLANILARAEYEKQDSEIKPLAASELSCYYDLNETVARHNYQVQERATGMVEKEKKSRFRLPKWMRRYELITDDGQRKET